MESFVYPIVSCVYHIVPCVYPIVSFVYPIVSRVYPIVSCMYPIVSCVYPIVSCMYRIISWVYPIISCVYPMVIVDHVENNVAGTLIRLLTCLLADYLPFYASWECRRQNYLWRAFEQGGMFIVPHLLRQGASTLRSHRKDCPIKSILRNARECRSKIYHYPGLHVFICRFVLSVHIFKCFFMYSVFYLTSSGVHCIWVCHCVHTYVFLCFTSFE
jgi:hypothetical protein